jgi:hypothetical protein
MPLDTAARNCPSGVSPSISCSRAAFSQTDVHACLGAEQRCCVVTDARIGKREGTDSNRLMPYQNTRASLSPKRAGSIGHEVDGLHNHYPLSGLGHHGTVPLPSIAPVDRRSPSVWFWIRARLTIEDDHSVADISTVDTSQNWDPASSLVGHLGYSQPGTAGALHRISLLHDCQLRSLIQVVDCGWIMNFTRRSTLDLFTNLHSDLANRPELKIRKQPMEAAGRLVEIHVVAEF